MVTRVLVALFLVVACARIERVVELPASLTADSCDGVHFDASIDAAMDAAVDAPSDGPVVWPAAPQTKFVDATGQHANVTIQAPTGYSTTAGVARPLVLILHGYGSDVGSGLQNTVMGWSNLRNMGVVGYLVLAPTGRLEAGTCCTHYWHASAACCDKLGAGDTDAAYLGGLIDAVIAAGWHVDRSRVFIVGRSNGGFMAERLACERADLFTSIVDLSGAASATADPPCVPSRPVSILAIHGTGDASISYTGGHYTGISTPFPAVLGVGGTLDQWRVRNGCAGPVNPTAIGIGDYDAAIAGNETDLLQEASCPADGAVDHWRMNGSGHGFTVSQPQMPVDILTWFEAHPR